MTIKPIQSHENTSPRRGGRTAVARTREGGSGGGTPAAAVRLLGILGVSVFATATAALAADASRGEQLFVECASCHTLEKGVHNVGPTLAGLFQRKAGGFDDYRYSPAMKRSNITWTPEELDKFIADPQVVVPANRMPYAGMTNATDRADLIAYLQRAAQ
jgi:cytochrome c